MGYLTEIVILNDAFHSFREDPELFGRTILDGIDLANRENKQVSVPFKGYANYICVERSRHADHHALFLHTGNCLTVIGAYETDFENLIKRNPELAASWIKRAKDLLKGADEALKKHLDSKKRFAVFENDKPAKYPECHVDRSWKNNKFDTFQQAEKYARNWLGIYDPGKGMINVNVPYEYEMGSTITIKEITPT